MNKVKVKPSTILSFCSGRLYSATPPTVLFGELCEVISGQKAVFTHELPAMREKYATDILNQCPVDFKALVLSWEHTPDWQERVKLIDEAFAEIEISA